MNAMCSVPQGEHAWSGKKASRFPSERAVISSLGEGAVCSRSAVYGSSIFSETFFQLGNMNTFFHLNVCHLLIIIFIGLLSLK